MSNIKTRQTYPDEIPVLQSIWEAAFGDTGKAAFFSHYYTPELSACVECDGVPVAAGYLLASGDLINGIKPVPSAMIYGVSTVPSHRGKGFGSAIVRELIGLARKYGYPAVVLCPSDDSLFEYYSNRSGLRDWFFIDEQRYQAPDTPESYSHVLTGISSDEYCLIREAILEGTPHLRHDTRVFEYQSMLCDELGGGLYKYGSSCAVIERQQDDIMLVKEILTPFNDSFEAKIMLSAISVAFPAVDYFVRTPASSADLLSSESSQTGIRRFGMLYLVNGDTENATNSDILPWYGMAFD